MNVGVHVCTPHLCIHTSRMHVDTQRPQFIARNVCIHTLSLNACIHTLSLNACIHTLSLNACIYTLSLNTCIYLLSLYTVYIRYMHIYTLPEGMYT